MAKQVVVRWDGDPIGAWTVDGTRALRASSGPDADVVLPVDPTSLDDGETTIGRFTVTITPIVDALPRARFRLGRGAFGIAASAAIHAALFAMLLVGGARERAPGGDDATNLATMKGYLSRIADRGAEESASRAPSHAAAVEAETPAAAPVPKPEPTATSFAHANTGGAGRGESGARGKAHGVDLHAGDDWQGTYLCAQGETDLVLRVTAVRDDDVRAVFDFTHAPTGVHGSYRMHGRIDSATGEATLVPDSWIERPPHYVTVGMRGRVAGGDFHGTITNDSCGGFSLHRRG